jgi:hypothetical protein
VVVRIGASAMARDTTRKLTYERELHEETVELTLADVL